MIFLQNFQEIENLSWEYIYLKQSWFVKHEWNEIIEKKKLQVFIYIYLL